MEKESQQTVKRKMSKSEAGIPGGGDGTNDEGWAAKRNMSEDKASIPGCEDGPTGKQV